MIDHHLGLFTENKIAALWCRIIGHRWQAVDAYASSKRSVCQVCLRCRENGWLLL